MISRLRFIILTFSLAFIFFQSCINDDNDSMEECSQGLSISFYSRTKCQAEATYPEVNDLMVFIFDKNDILVRYSQLNDINTGSGFTHTEDLESGLYTVTAWSGLNDYHFFINEVEEGATSKEDLLFSLERNGNQAVSLENINVYFGESNTVYVQEKTSGSVYDNIAVNILEVTNRITITVEGLPAEDEYEILIESGNGSMNIDGEIAEDETIIYNPEEILDSEILKSRFTLLKLETGPEYTIIIRNITEDSELYRGSLLGALILKNPYVNLNCDHDFTINFTAHDQCDCGTYTIAEIWVNNWLVHSYETEM
ncbi:MAG: FimB/Mfa2 family fimbrial subunit [Rikenellaceae bacterium]|nr:FimB/Mfa2 family fimbrial subunit [Rikenellaceae bacterium]